MEIVNDLVKNLGPNLGENLGSNVVNIVSAVLIFMVGLIIAFIVAKAIRKLLAKTALDQRLAQWVSGERNTTLVANIEKWVETAVFWLIMLFVIIGCLQALQLSLVSDPLRGLLDQLVSTLLNIGGALLLLGVAWVLATIGRMVLVRSLKTFGIDEKLNPPADAARAAVSPGAGASASQPLAISETLGNALYWFIFLLFLPAVLSALDLQGPLGPVQELLKGILGALPNLLAAVLYGLIGWFVARIIRTIVTNLLQAIGTDRFGDRFGLGAAATGGRGLSWLLGTFVFVAILIPVAISVLNALQIQAVSQPASEMLNDVLKAGPRIFAAGFLMAIAYVVGRYVSDLLTNVLTSLGFNNIFRWLGLQSGQAEPPAPSSEPMATGTTTLQVTPPPEPMDPGATVLQVRPTPEPSVSASPPASKTPSEILGIIAMVGILILFLVPATDLLGFAPLTQIVQNILGILGQVVIGVAVFAVGLYLANFAASLISSSGGKQARLVGQAARIAIIALVSAMALQQMGIATSIVNLAFGLLLGAIAVAIAVAFGFGSIDIAGEEVRHWLGEFKRNDGQ